METIKAKEIAATFDVLFSAISGTIKTNLDSANQEGNVNAHLGMYGLAGQILNIAVQLNTVTD